MKQKNEDIEKICAYCESSVIIRESDICICKHNGAMKQTASCNRFSLDLLKIAPIPRKLPEEGTVFFEI